MSIKNKIKSKLIKKKSNFDFFSVGGNTDDSISNVIDSLNSMEANDSEAKLNETSIDDGHGGRIELNQDENIIKK